jgi:GNAT superfamily N-acetyltransferase
MTLTVSLEPDPLVKRTLQQQLTALLPDWFKQGEASLKYADRAAALPGYVARLDGTAKGLLVYKKHGALAAEIVWLGVDPTSHRSGIGRGLVDAACDAARADGLRYLFVWTLHEESGYAPYVPTRRFYEAMEFEYAMEEHFPSGDNPLALYMRRFF